MERLPESGRTGMFEQINCKYFEPLRETKDLAPPSTRESRANARPKPPLIITGAEAQLENDTEPRGRTQRKQPQNPEEGA
jgi:hypothetical protein